MGDDQYAITSEDPAHAGDSVDYTTSEAMNTLHLDEENRSRIAVMPGFVQSDIPNQMAFIFNNLSFSNLANHAQYIKDILTTSEHLKWLSHYMVFKRVTTEYNYHNLYAEFVDVIDSGEFTDLVMSNSYFFIKSLLQSPLMTRSNSDKTCLRNLGHWLGLITLARNRPILTVEVDLKMLLIEAHLKGQEYMKFVLPFVSKVLEPCSHSKIFHLPNPWLASILSIVAEINSLPELDVSFRLEIELLLKNLKVNIDDIPASMHLEDVDRCRQQIEGHEQLVSETAASSGVTPQLSAAGPPGSTAMTGMAAILMRDDLNPAQLPSGSVASICPISSIHPMTDTQFQQPRSQRGCQRTAIAAAIIQDTALSAQQAEPDRPCIPLDAPVPRTRPVNPAVNTTVNSTGYHPKFTVLDIKSNLDLQSVSIVLDIKANIPALILYPQLRKHVPQCIFKTINEILPGLLERASKIALSTSEAIIKKDFCMCTDESLIRSCAHNMIAHLISGLVLIGGREQLFRQVIMSLTQLCCEALQRKRILESTGGSQSTPLLIAGPQLCMQQSLTALSTNHIEEIGKDGAIQIARDNIDACVCIMARITMHRSMQELERRLVPIYDVIRRSQAVPDPGHLNTYISSVHNERLPEGIRLRPGPLPPCLLTNYKLFAKTIAAFNPLPDDVCPDMAVIEFTYYVERILAELFTLLSYCQSDHCPDKSNPQRNETLKSIQSKVQKLYDVVNEVKETFDLRRIPFASDIAKPTSSMVVHICYCFMDIYDEETLFRISVDLTNRIQDCFFCIFRHSMETNILGPAWNCRTITRAIVQCTQQYRNNLLVIPIFIKFRLLNVPDLDTELRMEFRNPDTISNSSLYFTMNLLRYCLLECANPNGTTTSSSMCVPSGPITYNLSELQYTIDALHRCSILNPMVDECSWNILEVVRINYDLFNVHQDSMRTSGIFRPVLGLPVLYSAVAQVRSDSIRAHHNPSQLADLHERTARLFAHWVAVHRSVPGSDLSSSAAHQVFAAFVLQMNENGIFKADECIGGFFRGCVQVCITKAYDMLHHMENAAELIARNSSNAMEKNKENSRSEMNSLLAGGENGRFFNRGLVCQLSSVSRYHDLFEVCDAFVKLVVLLIKHSGDSRSFPVKVSLLNKVLGLIAGCCLIDAEIHGINFYALPYQRMFLALFRELCGAHFLNESTHYLFGQSIMSAYFLLNPLVCPSFTFAWLELIGHGPFMGRVLQTTGQIKNTQCWTMYSSLLCALLRFIGPFITSSTRGNNNDDDIWIAFIFKCTLRIFLILLHDFPEFLVEYAYELTEYVPSDCTQLRNLILSAYPRQMKLPDPSNPILKVDLLAEINITPPMCYNYNHRIQPAQFKSSLDNYLSSRSPLTFLATLRPNLTHVSGYNVKVMRAVVIYVGVRAIELMIRRGHHITTDNIGDCAHMDIFESLLTDLDFEGRYHFLNAMLNNIRFPSCHTHFFSCAVLHLFTFAESMAAKEQITRMLVERLVVHRPHPWGIRVTFTELVRNSSYRLVECPFVYKIPQIQSLFESAILGMPYVNQRLRSATVVSLPSTEASTTTAAGSQ